MSCRERHDPDIRPGLRAGQGLLAAAMAHIPQVIVNRRGALWA
jgi:hypothetical protein